MYQPNRGVDEDGNCTICGYAVELLRDSEELHECPPGFNQEKGKVMTDDAALRERCEKWLSRQGIAVGADFS